MIKIINKEKVIGFVVAGIIAAIGVTTAYISYNTNSSKEQVNTNQGVLGKPPSSSSSTSTTKGTATYTQSGGNASKSSQSITAADTDKSGVKIMNSGTLTLSNSMVTTTGKTSSEDNSNFYGLNAGILAETGSKINLTNCTVNTMGSGANAIFAAGTGSTVDLSNVTIKTTADSSRGLDATLTGTINAKNVNITTEGTHCAAIATDRGQGTVNVTGGTMNTTGVDSPCIYSTGKIAVADAKITATGSEAAVVEGKNSISLTNTTISGTKKRGVMMYQSFSGDAEIGTATFKMSGGALTSTIGPLFYATNTDAVIELKGAKLTAASGTLLEVGADEWGTKGSNGATVTLKADSQTLNGNIICDNISTITATLQNSTILNSYINTENKAKSIALTLDKTSTWEVIGDSYITILSDGDSTLANIHSNGNNIYYNSSNSGNSWLGGKTYNLSGGGKLTPMGK